MKDNAEELVLGNLNRMHLQTERWVDEIKFYKEELRFFHFLISEKINTTTTADLDHKKIYRNLEIMLNELSDDLISQIKKHGAELSNLIEEKDVSSNHPYNRKHLDLLEKMELIKQSVRRMKKALFKYIKNHPFDLGFDDAENER